MKDLAEDYAAEIERAAAELAAVQAEIAFRHVAAQDAAAEAAKAAIDATARESGDALDAFRARTEAAHKTLVARMTERARQFLSGPAPSETPGAPPAPSVAELQAALPDRRLPGVVKWPPADAGGDEETRKEPE